MRKYMDESTVAKCWSKQGGRKKYYIILKIINYEISFRFRHVGTVAAVTESEQHPLHIPLCTRLSCLASQIFYVRGFSLSRRR